ncbi:16136_t:CDS:2 [Entrophospora sp. SA101]|nr:15127_t:CDS:2 [Entrophospora sp. SA101]CAJ0751074.1 16136_t:CDS:2 [Entrophospora sp. SA101]CAJ0861000.1 12457_t:CDS:2 [Entrophospora sp. SA101]CAJ0903071.1 14187_t:CDS:2 [Entrophospora sp. SA101]CAJ0919481.1 13261_t:CDS:2 [Entrophospora sp. SA101]
MRFKIHACLFFLIIISEEILAINNIHNLKLYRKRAINQNAFEDCLKPITGEKVFKSSPNYNSTIIDENSAIEFLPNAIVFPNSVKDIQLAIECAKSFNLNITPRSGGHSYESYSLGGKDGALVVDLKNFNQIQIDKTNNLVKVGAGNRLGNIYFALSKDNYVVPAGTCPSVGISGHILGGGIGNLVRKFGKLSDQLVSVEMVLASGESITVDTNNRPDLFFGLRGGGGGNFGIVTSFTIRIHQIVPKVTTIGITWDLTTQQLHKVFNSVHKNSNGLTTDLTFNVVLTSDEIALSGVYLGDKNSASKVMNAFLNDVGSEGLQLFEESWFDSVVRISFESRARNINPKITPYNFKAKSFLVGKSGLSTNGLDTLVEFLKKIPCDTFAEFDVFAGGINVNPNKSILQHLDFFYGIQLLTSGWKSDKQGNVCIKQINDFGKSFQRDFTSPSSYINYIDRDLDDWPTRYYGDNLKTLQILKSNVDPQQLFKFPQSIPI